jgi:dihydrofolate synthase / folylpolyglutamate synthase
MRLGLERVERLLGALGEPHLAVPSVLIAGTNGKGSTAALLAAMCRAAGYRTGLYTSPHLESVTERLAVDGAAIDDERLAGYLERGLAAAGELGGEPPTYFEALTVAAFLHFRAAAVDLAILEVGLGGRLDATNVGTPELSIVTSISRDHERHLGTSLESIAGEKAAVLRRGRPALAWSEDAGVRRVLREQADAAGAALAFADPAAVSASTPATACPQEVRLCTGRGAYDLELFLSGRHQLANLSLAVGAAEILAGRGWPALTADAVARGVAGCRWPGRLEWVEIGGGRRVLLDAAHNAAGLEALADFVEQLPGRPDLLFGALEEKSIDGVLPRLAAATRRVMLTRPPSERAAPPERWSRHFAGRPTRVARDPSRALDDALASCRDTLLVCGSIFLVGRIRGLLRQRFGVPVEF